MRILSVNTSERTGGAAIAARRLMNALCRIGQEAHMLVRDKETADEKVSELPHTPLLRAKFIAERLGIWWENRFSRQGLFDVDTATHGTDITRLPVFRQADVIHLHWINQGMLSLADLRRILQSGKPVVWTMHDMWPCTGICHHSRECERWLTGCGHCPALLHGREDDLSHRRFLKKEEVYKTARMSFVGCSDWLSNIARRAPLLKGHDIYSIPNALNTHHYAPRDGQAARHRLGLPADKDLLLFVSHKATNPFKGIQFLREALARLCKQQPAMKERLHLVIVGRESTTLRETFAVPAATYEYVSDEHTMRDFYCAATLLMMPTLQDNLPNTIVEGMACGLPCVGFNVGGLPQLIDHHENGYLARLKNVADLAQGIAESVEAGVRERYSQSARAKALALFSEEAVARKYLEVYEHALAR